MTIVNNLKGTANAKFLCIMVLSAPRHIVYRAGTAGSSSVTSQTSAYVLFRTQPAFLLAASEELEGKVKYLGQYRMAKIPTATTYAPEIILVPKIWVHGLFTSNYLALRHEIMTPGQLFSHDKDLCAFPFFLECHLDSAL